MSCDCAEKVDRKLKPRNARLARGFFVEPGSLKLSPPMIVLEKIAPRGKKPLSLVASFCPFCGVKL